MNKNISRRSFILGGTAAVLGASAAISLGTKNGNALADTHNMKKAQWIWVNEENTTIDEYGEFFSEFDLGTSTKGATLEIACDGIYATFINGKLSNFAQCSDYPNYKLYDKIDISEKCKPGKNEIKIQVWFAPGQGCSTYKDTNTPGVLFEISKNNQVLAWSSTATLSRVMNEYWPNRHESISPQLGFNFWAGLDAVPGPYNDSSKPTQLDTNLHEREILPLQLTEPTHATLVGHYTDISEGENLESFVFALPKEVVGFLDFNLPLKVPPTPEGGPGKVTLKFTWGEHVVDGGRPRYNIRNFTSYVVCVDGDNQYMNPFRRIGARFIEIIIEKGVMQEFVPNKHYVTLRPVSYPVQIKPYKARDIELQQIYEASVYTLICCMHEHYEDCPWREQALYGMDSRNQMLCGYYAFEGHEFQRHNLILLSKSIREDGILDICAPCSADRPIPFFSLCFVLATYEYIMHTKDKSILKHIGNEIDRIMNACASKIDGEKGIMQTWQGNPAYWNFYEWSEASDGNDGKPYHLIMNCMFAYVHDLWKKITHKTYADTDQLRQKIVEHFKITDSQTGTYKYQLFDDLGKDSQLGNAMVLLAGIQDPDLKASLARDLKASQSQAGSMIKATLSMKGFVYDALLKNDENAIYREVVLDDIKVCWLRMMKTDYFSGTFWETEDGQAAFGNAGSLCHGWSAIPAYYIPKYFN